MLSKAVLGMAARAYPEISTLFNSGRCSLTKKQILRNKRIRESAPKTPTEEESTRISRECDMWKAFPTAEDLDPLTTWHTPEERIEIKRTPS